MREKRPTRKRRHSTWEMDEMERGRKRQEQFRAKREELDKLADSYRRWNELSPEEKEEIVDQEAALGKTKRITWSKGA